MEEKIIHYDVSARYEEKKIKGWWSFDYKSGTDRFWGEDEHMARWSGCTHLNCECGNVTERRYTKCESCRERSLRERYNSLKETIWEEGKPICIIQSDTYFFDIDELEDYCYDNKIDKARIMLVECVPQYAREIDDDYFADELCDDCKVPDELMNAMEEFNEVVRKSEPLSWVEGDKRIKL